MSTASAAQEHLSNHSSRLVARYPVHKLGSVFLTISCALSLICTAPTLCAQAKNADSFFVVTKASTLSAVSMFAPSSNESGDIVLRLVKAGNVNEIRAFFDADQIRNDGSTMARLLRTNSANMGSFPMVNHNKGIVSFLTLATGQQLVTRYTFVGTQGWTSDVIARSNPAGGSPFTFLSLFSDVDDNGNILFQGRDQPHSAVYSAGSEVTDPPNANYVASTRGGFSAFDGHVASSRDGKTVYRGSVGSVSGIYSGTPPVAIATDGMGFSLIGSRPTINNHGNVALIGINASLGGALIWFRAAGTFRYAGSFGLATSSIPVGVLPSNFLPTTARTTINNLNQVLFLATNAAGRVAVFTTNLGAMREILAVDDEVTLDTGPAHVTSLSTWGGFNDKGQITLLAAVQQGTTTETVVLRTNRAFYQTKVTESPITPSWSPTPTTGTGYLLRSLRPAEGGVQADPEFTLAKSGCNLTSTVNVLGFFGVQVSPIEFQNWLIAKWRAAAGANKNRYIVRHVIKRENNLDVEKIVNDFSEEVVAEYTAERVAQGTASTVVAFRGVFKNTSTTGRQNLDAVIAELRVGRAVKLRVPNGTGNDYNRFGHYVMAYGFRDPTKGDAQMSHDDILIHDPGNSGMKSLQDYGVNRGYDSSDRGWFEMNQHLQPPPPRTRPTDKLYRVYRYQGTAAAPQPMLIMTIYSPVEAVVTDPQGRRLGVDPAVGSYEEIPGGLYFAEDSYATLDAETSTPLPAWELPEPVKHVLIPSAQVASNYDVLLVGTGQGQWTLSTRVAGVASDSRVVSGTTTLGQRQTVRYWVQPQGVVTIGASTPACNGPIALQADRAPRKGEAAFALLGAAAPASTPGVLLIGAPSRAQVRALGVDFYVDFAQALVQVPISSNAAGASRVPIPLPASLARGSRIGVQCVWLNTAGCGGAGTLSASEALELTIQP